MKSQLYKCFLMILIVYMTVSCATVSNISVNNASDSEALQQGSFIYALPQTILDVSVVAEEISIIPGPYERYAHKYLGIENAPSKPEKIFNLKSISISRHLEADPDFIYSVNGLSDFSSWPNLRSLLEDSLILSAADFAENQTTTFNWRSQTNDILYTDLSIKRNFEAEKDIEISMVLPDTDYVAPPQSAKTVLKEKTPEQKAEEAANFLIKLKKRRFKLVAGQYDYMPGGESMSAALKELGRIEQEYLALFIGRRINSEVKRNFHFNPEPGENNKRVVLFRFSPTHGFVNADESEGIPVVIELHAMNKTRELGNGKLPLRLQSNTLPYRIADQVNIRLLAGEQIWVEAIYPVFQYGTPVSMMLAK
ncbi:MAG TPA: DUF4831 family protein [Bacteroidales bacterium]|nr:DUF4831 family protein [Bacteroidales bacterium]